MDLKEKILNLLDSKSVILVGPSDSGKTHWIRNVFIPHLEAMGKTVAYLEDGDGVLSGSPDIVICDEAETLFDNDGSLSEEYLKKVNSWFKNYAQFPKSTVFIVTRNTSETIKNLIDNMKNADWDSREVEVLEFKP